MTETKTVKSAKRTRKPGVPLKQFWTIAVKCSNEGLSNAEGAKLAGMTEDSFAQRKSNVGREFEVYDTVYKLDGKEIGGYALCKARKVKFNEVADIKGIE